MKDNKLFRCLLGAAGYIGLLFAGSGVAVLVLLVLGIDNTSVASIASAIASLAAVCLWLRHKQRDLPASLSVAAVPVKTVLLVIGMSVVVTGVVQCIQLLFPPAMRDSLANTPFSGNLALDIACYVIATPVLEEVFFRALMIPVLLQGMGRVAAIIVSGAVFAVFHGSVLWILLAFCISLFYSYVFLKTESVIPCIAAHMTSNALAVAYHILFA